ncbi:MAG: cysteine--tRNA ligase, partial [Hyphomicrobiaceae bacterium]|nr:cysteine--tRNA ligase [Hyphomicrobiaceae bacterium]
TFDIHGGGLDLIFPHHENEIAQSCCAHGTAVMAHTWLHNGFVQVEGQKMSKSLGNFVTMHDLLETETFGGRKWPGAVIRLALLMTHYREPLDFSQRRLEEAERLYAKWPQTDAGDAPVPQVILDALCDDLNTVAAVQALHQLAGDDPEGFAAAARLLGIDKQAARLEAGAEEEVEAAVARRLALIRDKNWAEADAIRDELAARGIQLKDGKDPATGERITAWEVKG